MSGMRFDEALNARLGQLLERHFRPIFGRGWAFTIIARRPGDDEADVLVTSDDLDEVAALIQRSKSREQVG